MLGLQETSVEAENETLVTKPLKVHHLQTTEVIQRIKCSKRDGQNYRNLAKILINGSQKSSVCELLKLSGEIDDKWLRNIIVD